MADSIQVAAFTGGELKISSFGETTGEAVLALPLSRLIVRMVRVPEENRDDPSAFATPILSALSPFPDEPLTVACETVRDNENGLIVLAAALPEGATDDIATALDAAKLNITRVDALALGELRALWPQLENGKTGVRRLLLMKSTDCITLFVLDDDQPSAIRAFSDASDLRREVMLSLLEAEDFGGSHPLSEIIVVGDIAAEVLASFAPVRHLDAVSEELTFASIAERAADSSSLDALPASWRELLEETRFKAKLIKYLAIAGGIWLMIMAVLFGVPVVYGFLTDHQKSMSREHSKQFKAVKAMKEKVGLVRKYSDHTRGALEIMREVTECLPLPEDADSSCIELSNWNFRREEGVNFSGEAATAALVYQFKDALVDSGVFAVVELQGPSAGKGSRQRFSIDCRFEAEEEK